jgi:DDE superfamily endonuclease.
MEKFDLRRATKEEKEAIRKRAILMHTNGKKNYEIVSSLGVNKNSVSTWISSYKLSGMAGLKEKTRGVKKGEGRILNEKQEKQIQKWIVDKMPEQLKLPFGLWTRKAIQELIKNKFEIKIAIRTVGDYLKRWGFTPQKPKRKAYEQNPKLVKQWLEKEYPKIVAKAKVEQAEIHWGDETGVKNECQYGRSYAPKGKTPTRTIMAKKISLNMISSVTNQGKVRFMTYKGGMNSQMFIKFLKQLTKGATNKIYLILDNLRVHHSKQVKAWVKRNADAIQLFYLPSYSPEMNPDEYLNCDLKYGLAAKPSPRTQGDLKSNVISHMRLLQKSPDRVKSYFKHESIKYAA